MVRNQTSSAITDLEVFKTVLLFLFIAMGEMMRALKISAVGASLLGVFLYSAASEANEPHGNGFWGGAGWYETFDEECPPSVCKGTGTITVTIAAAGPFGSENECRAYVSHEENPEGFKCDYHQTKDASVRWTDDYF